MIDQVENIIETINLSIGYSNDNKLTTIQSTLNLQLRKGELCCLIGPNGVGKSTLLRTISSQLKPLNGEVKLLGTSITDYDNQQLSKKLSVVLTESIQVPNLKVKELVAMGRFPYTNFWGKINRRDEEKVDEAIQLLGLKTLAERNFIELSDGEKQKALIAKALAQETPLILLDEPTAFLDFPSKMAILAELREIAHTKKIGIILSTHDLELALKMADLIWLFPENNQIRTGAPEDLVLSGDITKAFSNEFLSFDLETAHFAQRIKTTDILNVEGTSLESEWIKKALVRKGISANPSKKMPYTAVYNSIDKKFILKEQNEVIGTFDTIKDILAEIENIN